LHEVEQRAIELAQYAKRDQNAQRDERRREQRDADQR